MAKEDKLKSLREIAQNVVNKDTKPKIVSMMKPTGISDQKLGRAFLKLIVPIIQLTANQRNYIANCARNKGIPWITVSTTLFIQITSSKMQILPNL